MQYTERGQLTILELKDGEDHISMERLKAVLSESPSNMIYCERGGRLAGIVSTGDIWRAYEADRDSVAVNRKFTWVCCGESWKARGILKAGRHINAVPVVTAEHVLAGDYTRWDDLLAVDYLLEADYRRGAGRWEGIRSLVLVRPGRAFTARWKRFEKFKGYLGLRHIEVRCIEHPEVSRYLEAEEAAGPILFVDEDEMRACSTYLRIVFGRYGSSRLMTYQGMIGQGSGFDGRECAAYLRGLQGKGIGILGLEFREGAYHRPLRAEMAGRFAAIGKEPGYRLPEAMYQDFFDDLYSEEYADGILRMPIENSNGGGAPCLKGCASPYYNVADGERKTAGQPERYRRSVYFYGGCYIFGLYVEDRNTIESFLQERICRGGGDARVVNCGAVGSDIGYRYLIRIAGAQLRKGDIIVVDRPPEGVPGAGYLNLLQILEENGTPAEWFVDEWRHCNHKVNRLYADAIYDALAPVLAEDVDGQGEPVEKEDDFVASLYFERHFSGFDPAAHGKIGSIVMNCNPFTLGHRHLIEQALTMADFLILFVVEEDRSDFSFVERLVMVREGTADLGRVMVVPSGPFILSQTTFPEYFLKETRETLAENTENDIRLFAEKIAPRLGIRCRFCGEEPLDEVTRQYNRAMEKILPRYGIEAVVIPRKEAGGEAISASRVRKCLEEGEWDRLGGLLPETTRRILGLGNR